MKSGKKLGLVMIFLALALVSVGAVAALTLKVPDLSGLSGFFNLKVIVNVVIIGAIFYFALPLLGQKIQSPQAITAALILIAVVSIAIAVNIGPDKFIWEKEMFEGVKDFLFGDVGILTYDRITIFIGASVLFYWFFAFLKVGGEKSKINIILAILLGAELASSPTIGIAEVLQMGEVIAIYIIYHNLQATVTNKVWAFIMSFALVEYIVYILSGEGIVIGTLSEVWGLKGSLIFIVPLLLLGGLGLSGGALLDWAKKGEEGSVRKGAGKSFGYQIEYWGKQALMRIPGLKRANWKVPIKEGEDPRAISEMAIEIANQRDNVGRFKTYNANWEVILESKKKVNELLGKAGGYDYYELKKDMKDLRWGGPNIADIRMDETGNLLVVDEEGHETPFRGISFGWERLNDMSSSIAGKINEVAQIENNTEEKVARYAGLLGIKYHEGGADEREIKNVEDLARLFSEEGEEGTAFYRSLQNAANTYWNNYRSALTDSAKTIMDLANSRKERFEKIEGFKEVWDKIIDEMANVYSAANPSLGTKYPHTYIIKSPPEGGEYETEEIEVDGVTIEVPKANELPYYEGFKFDVDELERMGYRMLPPQVFFMLINRHWDNHQDDLKDGRYHPYSRTMGDYRLAMHRRIYDDKDIKNWFGPPTHKNFAYDKKAVEFKHFGSLNYYDHNPVFGKIEELRLRDNDPVTGKPIHEMLGVAASDEVVYAQTITRGRWKGQFKLKGKAHIWTTESKKGVPVLKYIPRPDEKEPQAAHSSTKGFSSYLWDLLGFEYSNAEQARKWFLDNKEKLVTPDVSGSQWGVYPKKGGE